MPTDDQVKDTALRKQLLAACDYARTVCLATGNKLEDLLHTDYFSNRAILMARNEYEYIKSPFKIPSGLTKWDCRIYSRSRPAWEIILKDGSVLIANDPVPRLIYKWLAANVSRFGNCGELAIVCAVKLWLEKNPLIKKIELRHIAFYKLTKEGEGPFIQDHLFLIVNDAYIVDPWATNKTSQLLRLNDIDLVTHVRELLNQNTSEANGFLRYITSQSIVKQEVICELEGEILANFPEWALTARVELYPSFIGSEKVNPELIETYCKDHRDKFAETLDKIKKRETKIAEREVEILSEKNSEASYLRLSLVRE